MWKSPRSVPIGANMTESRPKSAICVPNVDRVLLKGGEWQSKHDVDRYHNLTIAHKNCLDYEKCFKIMYVCMSVFPFVFFLSKLVASLKLKRSLKFEKNKPKPQGDHGDVR